MKPAFKTTAVAILVALGVTACSGGGSKGGNAQEVAPTPVNPQTPAPTPKPESTVPTRTPEKPSSGYQYNDNLKNKYGKEWRLVDTSLRKQSVWNWDGYESNVEPIDDIGDYQPSLKLNFNQLSGNQLGKFSGTTEGDFLLSRSSAPSNKLDYTFINQPYSTYGVLTDEHGKSDTFAIIQRSATFTSFADPYGLLGATSDRAEYSASPKGSATYKGNVFADISYERGRLAKEDGTFEVTADFDNSTVSGKLNSDTVGEIKLVQASFNDEFSTKHNELAYLGSRRGEYKISFGGKDLNDVVGRVDFSGIQFDENRQIQVDGVDRPVDGYKAAFGGTKQ